MFVFCFLLVLILMYLHSYVLNKRRALSLFRISDPATPHTHTHTHTYTLVHLFSIVFILIYGWHFISTFNLPGHTFESECFSTFLASHKLQLCSYIGKFCYIYVIGVKINKKLPHLFQRPTYYISLNFPTPSLLRPSTYSVPKSIC